MMSSIVLNAVLLNKGTGVIVGLLEIMTFVISSLRSLRTHKEFLATMQLTDMLITRCK